MADEESTWPDGRDEVAEGNASHAEHERKRGRVPPTAAALMQPHEALEGILPGHGFLFRQVLIALATIPPQAFVDAVNRIERETTLGPMLNPTAYLDGRRFDNARDYQEIMNAALKLRAVLDNALGGQD